MSRVLPRELYGEELRNFGVRREKLRPRARTILAYAAAVAFLLGSLLLYVSQGIQVIRLGYELDRLQDRYRELRAERGRLEVELASLQDLAVVGKVAVEQLGMVQPQLQQVIVVRGAGAAPALPVAGSGPRRGRDLAARVE